MGASPTAREDPAAALEFSDHADPTALAAPGHSSPSLRAAELLSDMDISQFPTTTPPNLRPGLPSADLPNPVARRTLNPYLNRGDLPPRAYDLPKAYPLSRAVALAAGDTSVPPELIPRLRAVLNETRVGDGLYIRDVVNLALNGRADSHPSFRPAGSPGDAAGPSRARRGRRLLAGPAQDPPGPTLPAVTLRALSPLPLPLVTSTAGSSRQPSPGSYDSNRDSLDLSDHGPDQNALSTSASDAPARPLRPPTRTRLRRLLPSAVSLCSPPARIGPRPLAFPYFGRCSLGT
jgi:hypothetical protein